jgi:osmoprotectant transport system permease protein
MLLVAALASHARASEPVRVGAKNFTEQLLLGEMIAQTIEATTSLAVERRFQLGGTQVAFEALRGGAIDVYPEYTGTGLLAVLKEEAPADRAEARRRVDAEFRARFGLAWLAGFGFENTYAIAVRADDERFARVRTVSDLASSRAFAIAGTHEFIDRADGWSALALRYALSARDVVALDPGLLYEAIASKQVDVIAAFSTDARVEAFHLRLLEDDRRFFPAYEAAPVARVATLDANPALGPALARLAGTATDAEMRGLAYEVDVRGRDARAVVAGHLAKKGIASHATIDTSSTNDVRAYFWSNRAYVGGLVVRHLVLTLVALAFAAIAGTLLGFAVARSDRLAAIVFPVIGTVQTIPSLALLGFLVPIAGIGVRPALVALFLYALLPIVRSTNAGIRSVDPRLVDVGRGIGLTDAQILRRIEVPLALPTILSGVRTSAVILVGTATLASLVGAGGLGDPIFRGLSTLKTPTILLGAIPAAALALALDRILGIVEGRLVSPGLRKP